MTGAVITIDGASAAGTILSVKERVYAANSKLPVRRQRLVYSAGPRGMDALADDETLGGAGVAQDGSAELDVLLADMTTAEVKELGSRLLEAASDGRSNVMLELLDACANVNFTDDIRSAALMLAATHGHSDCVRLLVNAGANKEHSGRGGWTPLIGAAVYGHPDCVRVLLDGGADKEAMDNLGRTALIRAAPHGHSDCARLLLDAGADTDIMDKCRETALMSTARFGHVEFARMLLDARADKAVRNDDGRNALGVGQLHSNHEMARLIELHSCAPSSEFEQGPIDATALETSNFCISVIAMPVQQ